MKLMGLTVPVLIVSLTVIAVWGIGMLAVRASAISTQTSIDLLRMHLQVARLHEQLLGHSKDALAAQVKELVPDEAIDSAEAGRPWPEEMAEPGSGSTLEQGLRQARPALHRLIGSLDRTLPAR